MTLFLVMHCRSYNTYFALAFQYDVLKSKKIQIKSQPRTRFRPRTQNESKTSAHYIRCEEDDKLDYPAIFVRCHNQQCADILRTFIFPLL
jgi:hypothetical protein